MFDGTLGTWNTTPVDLGLKDDAKPVLSLTYPVPSQNTRELRGARRSE